MSFFGGRLKMCSTCICVFCLTKSWALRVLFSGHAALTITDHTIGLLFAPPFTTMSLFSPTEVWSGCQCDDAIYYLKTRLASTSSHVFLPVPYTALFPWSFWLLSFIPSPFPTSCVIFWSQVGKHWLWDYALLLYREMFAKCVLNVTHRRSLSDFCVCLWLVRILLAVLSWVITHNHPFFSYSYIFDGVIPPNSPSKKHHICSVCIGGD